MKLIRFSGYPALTGHYVDDLIPDYDGSNPSERFVSSGRQTIPLMRYQHLKLRNILGIASSPLPYVPLEVVTQHDAQDDVAPVAESSLTPALSRPDVTAPPSRTTLILRYVGRVITNANIVFAFGALFPPTSTG